MLLHTDAADAAAAAADDDDGDDGDDELTILYTSAPAENVVLRDILTNQRFASTTAIYRHSPGGVIISSRHKEYTALAYVF